MSLKWIVVGVISVVALGCGSDSQQQAVPSVSDSVPQPVPAIDRSDSFSPGGTVVDTVQTASHALTEDEADSAAAAVRADSQAEMTRLVATAVRYLPPSAYPELAGWVVRVLEDLKCEIPQMSAEGAPRANVIRGRFFPDSSAGWAVLCLTAGEAGILVFSSDSSAPPLRLARHPATEFLRVTSPRPEGGTLWSREIHVLTPKEALDWCIYPDSTATHEGIIDDGREGLVGAYYLRRSGRPFIDCPVPNGD